MPLMNCWPNCAPLSSPTCGASHASAEALAQLAALPAGAPDALREYLHGDYLILYSVVDASSGVTSSVYLLSIRHHRQLSFDFGKLWPGA